MAMGVWTKTLGLTMSKREQATCSSSANECPTVYGFAVPRESLNTHQNNKPPYGGFFTILFFDILFYML